jgi:DNA-binding SARP family transcriptional activator
LFLLCSKRLVSNEEILEGLWPEVSFELSRSALKTNIYRLRQALFYDCTLAKESGYCINPDVPVEFDMESFLQSLNLAARHGTGSEAGERHLLKAIGLYKGPFLNGFNLEWCQGLRTDLELKYHTALTSLAAYRAIRGDFLQATELLEKVIAADPYN